MKDLVFITGNQHKADYLAKWLDMPIPHRKIDLAEIQSLDTKEVVEHKARAAYEIAHCPVLVEDVSLVFHGMGRLPGTLVKWFLEELGVEGLCTIGNSLTDKTATASMMYALFDGKKMVTFAGSIEGTISPEPRSIEAAAWKGSKSWNDVFIPNGSSKTYAEMNDDEIKPFSMRVQAIEKLKR